MGPIATLVISEVLVPLAKDLSDVAVAKIRELVMGKQPMEQEYESSMIR